MQTKLDWDTMQPEIPNITFNVIDYGAIGDGTFLNTAVIQQTIDDCAKAGGGRVLFQLVFG